MKTCEVTRIWFFKKFEGVAVLELSGVLSKKSTFGKMSIHTYLDKPIGSR